MTEPQSLSRQQQKASEIYCTSMLRGVFGMGRSDEQLRAVSTQMVDAGMTIKDLLDLSGRVRNMGEGERHFLNQMNRRGFTIEQMLILIEAPTEAHSFSVKTRQSIMEEVNREWKKSPGKYLSESVSRGAAASSLIVLAGIVTGASIFAGGAAINSQNIKDTAIELVSFFPSLVTNMLNTATGSLVGFAGALAASGVAIKIGKKFIDTGGAAKKARAVSLDGALAQEIPANSFAQKLNDYETTRALKESIPVAYQNLLTHLGGVELRVFLHGNDRVREDILRARPPSYTQRLACISALDSNFIARAANQIVLAGTTWDGALAQRRATLKESLAAMRQSKSELAPSQPTGLTPA